MHLKLALVSYLLLAETFKKLQKCKVLKKAMKNNRSRKTSVNRDKRIVSKSFKKLKNIGINLTSQQRLSEGSLRFRY